MKKLCGRRQILGAEVPGRIDAIVDKLFPRKETTLELNSMTEEGNVRTELQQQVIEITEMEVIEEVLKNEFLKAVIQLDPKDITKVYNMCLKESYYPIDWKVSNIVLIHKPGRPPGDPSSYRPLCMLNTVCKLFERILTRRLNAFLEDSRILCDSQFGFRKKRSTLDAIKRLLTIIKTGNERKKVVGMLTLDVCNAFNTAPWTKINAALKEMNAPEYIQKIVGLYLSDRKIQYTIGDEEKEYRVDAGV